MAFGFPRAWPQRCQAWVMVLFSKPNVGAPWPTKPTGMRSLGRGSFFAAMIFLFIQKLTSNRIKFQPQMHGIHAIKKKNLIFV
jgi:hypothetical protein